MRSSSSAGSASASSSGRAGWMARAPRGGAEEEEAEEEEEEEAIRIRAQTSSNIVTEMRDACAQLPPSLREALEQVRYRVARDELPLFSLLQTEPLRLQSSHLSFQEYFAAQALCEEGTRLSGVPPWQWSAWWSNAVKIGSEMGGFGSGLLRAADVQGDTLSLSRQLSGDRPTVLAALCTMLKGSEIAKLECVPRPQTTSCAFVCQRPLTRLSLSSRLFPLLAVSASTTLERRAPLRSLPSSTTRRSPLSCAPPPRFSRLCQRPLTC